MAGGGASGDSSAAAASQVLPDRWHCSQFHCVHPLGLAWLQRLHLLLGDARLYGAGHASDQPATGWLRFSLTLSVTAALHWVATVQLDAQCNSAAALLWVATVQALVMVQRQAEGGTIEQVPHRMNITERF